jgi:hypothetical protein
MPKSRGRCAMQVGCIPGSTLRASVTGDKDSNRLSLQFTEERINWVVAKLTERVTTTFPITDNHPTIQETSAACLGGESMKDQ